MPDRRRQPRYPLSPPLCCRLTGPGARAGLSAMLEEVSPGGAALYLREPVSPGAGYSLDLPGGQSLGLKVVSVRRDGPVAFLAGCRFDRPIPGDDLAGLANLRGA